MTRRTTLFLVCAFEVVLILVLVAWSALASDFTEYKSNGYVEVEKCVEAMSEGFIVKREERTDDTGWKLLNVRSLHEDKMFSFSYRNLGPKHFTDCIEWTEKE